MTNCAYILFNNKLYMFVVFIERETFRTYK